MQASRKTSNQTNATMASQKSQVTLRPSSPPPNNRTSRQTRPSSPLNDKTGRQSGRTTYAASSLQQSLGLTSRSQVQDPGGSDRTELEEQTDDVQFLGESFVYEPPPTNFVRVLHGDHETLVLNTGCRSQIFLDHLRDKLQVKAWVSLDLCNEEGTLLGLNKLDPNDYIRQLVQSGEKYIPCVLLRDGTGCLAKIKPCLKKWRKLYPRMEEALNQAIFEDQEVVRQRQETAAPSTVKSKEQNQTQEQQPEKKKKGKKLSVLP